MSTRPAVLITGGARRVGAALAHAYALKGYDVALHYHHSASEANALRDEITKLGVACELFQHDLADIAGLEALMAQVKSAFPEVELLINNASVFERGEFLQTDEALFDRQLDINFKAPFFLSQAFAKQIRRGGIINILDTDIVNTQGSHFAYLLSKKALSEFTRMAARALGPEIRVNAVCPGIMLPSNEMDEAYMANLAPNLPLEKLATVENLSQTVWWLSQQSHLTGQLIDVDGGQSLL